MSQRGLEPAGGRRSICAAWLTLAACVVVLHHAYPRMQHIVHTPLQVPEPWLKKFDFMQASDKDTHERQIYHSMVHFADAVRQPIHSLAHSLTHSA
jgi:hypothetical protein